MKATTLLLAMSLLHPTAATGQSTSAASRLDSLVAAGAAGTEGGVPERPHSSQAGSPRSEDAALAYADSASLQAYAAWGLQHRQRVFEWQYRSSRIIFVAVLFLVFAGVVFSGLQFYLSARRPASAAPGKADGGTTALPEAAASEIELSPGKVKISSPVLGVIILGLSLGFFYLYLVFVYPIAETF